MNETDRGVLVVCTDRGAHAPVKVARFVVREDGRVGLRPIGNPNTDPHAEERIRYDFDSPRHVAQLRCIRCGRNARRPLVALCLAADALAARGVDEVELSALC